MRKSLLNVKLAAVSLGIFLGPLGWADTKTEVTVSTDLGEFVIELYAEDAPLHVANFLQYVDQGFYSRTVFHRVVAGFMVQAGGYDRQLADKDTNSPVMNESKNGLSNVRGSVAAARLSDPHSADSQFYINLVDNLSLDGSRKNLGYTVFGRVTSGMEIIDAIAELPTGAAGRFKDNVPTPLVGITSIRRGPSNVVMLAGTEARASEHPERAGAQLEAATISATRSSDGEDLHKAAQADDGEVIVTAAAIGSLPAVLNLLEQGYDIDYQRDRDGATALLIASVGGHDEIVQILLDRGAKVDPVSSSGETPLIGASFEGHDEIVQSLLAHGANSNKKLTEDGYTALMLAATNGHEGIVQALLAAGADVDLKDKKGKTALDFATTRRTQQLLRATGATGQPSAQDSVTAAWPYLTTGMTLAEIETEVGIEIVTGRLREDIEEMGQITNQLEPFLNTKNSLSVHFDYGILYFENGRLARKVKN